MKPITFSHIGIAGLILLTGLFLAGCSASKNTASVNRAPAELNSSGYVKTNVNNPSNLELADHLRKVSGLTVTGKGPNVSIRVRGVKSIHAGTEPLFVLDGTPVGTSYGMIADAINPNDIKSIRVLKGPDATIYGTRGANGVILIRMNRR